MVFYTVHVVGIPKRTLRFRAFFYDGADYSTGQMISFNEAKAENYIEWGSHTLRPTDECTIIMQSTNSHDVGLKEIYEGDVVYLAGVGYCAVVFVNASWAFENSEVIHFFNEVEWSDVGNIMGSVFTHSHLVG